MHQHSTHKLKSVSKPKSRSRFTVGPNTDLKIKANGEYGRNHIDHDTSIAGNENKPGVRLTVEGRPQYAAIDSFRGRRCVLKFDPGYASRSTSSEPRRLYAFGESTSTYILGDPLDLYSSDGEYSLYSP